MSASERERLRADEQVIRDALRHTSYLAVGSRTGHADWCEGCKADKALTALLDALSRSRVASANAARQIAATARQQSSLDMGSAVGWEHRALAAEARAEALTAENERLNALLEAHREEYRRECQRQGIPWQDALVTFEAEIDAERARAALGREPA